MNAVTRKLFAILALMVWLVWSGVAVSADAIPGEEHCNRTVSSIVFVGNRVTKPQVLLREIEQLKDTACSIDQIVDSTQSILDLGLFKTVYADLTLVDDRLQLRFTVKEKLYFLVIPRISRTSDAELRGGVQMRFDNFLGRLHEMRITSERRKEDDGEGPGGFVHRLGYNIPRFFGSDYGFAFEVGSDRRQLNLEIDGNEIGSAQSETRSIGLSFSRWLNQSKGVQGLRYFFGARLALRELDVLRGDAGPYTGGQDFSFILGFENKRIHQDTYRRRGTVYGTQLTLANSNIASDFEYSRIDVYGKAFIPLRNGIRNLNLQGQLGVSDGAAFGESSYSFGGGEKFRGMQTEQATGELMALLNIEYLHAWFNYPQWRWVAFTDIGNVAKRSSKGDLLNLRARAGLGLRWKLEALSNTDLRVDVAWDPSRERVQTYVSSNLTF